MSIQFCTLAQNIILFSFILTIGSRAVVDNVVTLMKIATPRVHNQGFRQVAAALLTIDGQSQCWRLHSRQANVNCDNTSNWKCNLKFTLAGPNVQYTMQTLWQVLHRTVWNKCDFSSSLIFHQSNTINCNFKPI